MSAELNNATVNEAYLNHNVGYTIVGNPTITDGVVSGFSSRDYLICNKTKPECSSFEKQIKFTVGTIGTYQAIFATMQNERYDGLFLNSSGKLNCTLSKAGGGSQDNTINYVLSENITYIVYLQLSSNQLLTIIKNTDGQQLHSQTFTFSVNNQELANVSFGRRFTTNTNSFNGSIDLNNTYIKINGITWFNGKETASSIVNEVYYNKNCGYTIAGSPTITDGVASGFSASNYLSLPEINLANPFEIFFKIKTPATWGSAYDVILSPSTSNRYGFQKNGPNKQFSYYVPNESGTGRTQHNGTTGLLEDTIYYIRTRFTGTQLIIDRSTDKTNWTVEWQENRTVGFFSSAYAIGRNATAAQQAWTGSIDLNNTYIKINGITFFNGEQQASNAVWTRGA